METNQTPFYDQSVNTTGCCPRFDPKGWDGQDLHFKDKRFIRATTHSVMHVPLNMGRVFGRVIGHIASAKAEDPAQAIVLSRDLSAFEGEHLFAVTKDVPGEAMTSLSGDYVTKVFEGPFSESDHWMQTLQDIAEAKGATGKSSWFFYTTCPKCAKVYGKNYVVGLAEV